MDDKLPLKDARSGHVNHLHFGGHQPYIWSGQILHTARLCQVPAKGWQLTLKRGAVRVTWPVFLNSTPIIS